MFFERKFKLNGWVRDIGSVSYHVRFDCWIGTVNVDLRFNLGFTRRCDVYNHLEPEQESDFQNTHTGFIC